MIGKVLKCLAAILIIVALATARYTHVVDYTVRKSNTKKVTQISKKKITDKKVSLKKSTKKHKPIKIDVKQKEVVKVVVK